MALILGQAVRVPPAAAALANATAGHALDYDDSSPPMIGHPSVNLMSALFALGERDGRSGSDIERLLAAGLAYAHLQSSTRQQGRRHTLPFMAQHPGAGKWQARSL